MNATKKPPRHGFTLVEMLAVVVIIAILASLITAAAIAARRKAKIAVINMEINQLDMAVKAYKEKFGDYPPDFWGVNHTNATIQANARAAILRHLRKAFPRYTLTGTATQQWDQFRLDVKKATGNTSDGTGGLNIDTLTPAAAMTFCLGGIPSRSPCSTKLLGFSANPSNPFYPYDGTGSRLPSLFEFDEARLLVQYNTSTGYPTIWPMYAPDISSGNNAPYVYFRARRDSITGRQEYGTVSGTTFTPFSLQLSTTNICVPYHVSDTDDPTILSVSANVRKWNNPRTFQIISAGMDGMFSHPASLLLFRHAGSGSYFSGGDYDNQTNFCKGTLEDELP